MQCKELVITDTEIADVTVTNLTGPASVLKGTIATFTATITNSGTANTSVVVSFMEAVSATLISLKGTGIIVPGGSQDLPIDIDTSSWGLGNWMVCAKTAQETTYSICKAFQVYGEPLPPPATSTSKPGIPVGAVLVVSALVVGLMIMSKRSNINK